MDLSNHSNRNTESLPPDWRDILDRARDTFGGYEGCIGLAFGEKRTDGRFTGRPAVVIYVAEKRAPEDVPRDQLIEPDATFEGCATDVVAPFGRGDRRFLDYVADHQRSHDLAAVNYVRIHESRRLRIEALPKAGRVDSVGEVLVMEDPDGRFITSENGEELIDLVAAYRTFREQAGDEYDFVTFFSDAASGMPSFDTSFQWGVHNDIEGIGLPPYDYREFLGGPERLQSIHFIHHMHLNRYVMLQEMAHRWCAFVGFRETATAPNRYDLLIPSGAGARSHWGVHFDDDRSPVDYDNVDWIQEGPGVFRAAAVSDAHRRYCNLDLYLMGLMPAAEVGSFYYLDEIRPIGDFRYAARQHILSTANVVLAEGERVPSASHAQRYFRQAFVLLTRSFTAGRSFAMTIDRFRMQFQSDFAEATGNRAAVDTTLERGRQATEDGYIEQVYDRRIPIAGVVPGGPPRITQSSLSFVEDATIREVAVSVDIRHPAADELQVSLLAPDGAEVSLREETGGSGGQIDVTFTVENTPDLSRLNGRSARGEWVLRIADAWTGESGFVEAWAIRLDF